MGRARLVQGDKPWWSEGRIDIAIASNYIFGAHQGRRRGTPKQDNMAEHLLDVQEPRPTS